MCYNVLALDLCDPVCRYPPSASPLSLCLSSPFYLPFVTLFVLFPLLLSLRRSVFLPPSTWPLSLCLSFPPFCFPFVTLSFFPLLLALCHSVCLSFPFCFPFVTVFSPLLPALFHFARRLLSVCPFFRLRPFHPHFVIHYHRNLSPHLLSFYPTHTSLLHSCSHSRLVVSPALLPKPLKHMHPLNSHLLLIVSMHLVLILSLPLFSLLRAHHVPIPSASARCLPALSKPLKCICFTSLSITSHHPKRTLFEILFAFAKRNTLETHTSPPSHPTSSPSSKLKPFLPQGHVRNRGGCHRSAPGCDGLYRASSPRCDGTCSQGACTSKQTVCHADPTSCTGTA